ncbi:MAG: hypothetical protein IAE89_09240 [Anaerolineae bacterium]|nr:hypothetical protein [Anaerolineae bacterium]
MSKTEAFTQSLYEDADLREDLTDAEAEPLFQWAGEVAHQLEESGVSEEEFESKTKQLRQLIKRANRFVGQRSYAGADVHQQQLADLRAAAQTLGLTPPDEPITASADDSPAYMGALLAQMGTAGYKEPITPESSTPAAPVESSVQPESVNSFHGWRSWLSKLNEALETGNDEG